MKSAHRRAYERTATYRRAQRRLLWSSIVLGAMIVAGLATELTVGAWIAP